MLPSGDSDLDSDDDGLIEFVNRQGGGTTNNGEGTSAGSGGTLSGIKIVRSAKDNALSQWTFQPADDYNVFVAWRVGCPSQYVIHAGVVKIQFNLIRSVTQQGTKDERQVK